MGQSETSTNKSLMSVRTSTADVDQCNGVISSAPRGDIATLLDYLAGAGEQCDWEVDAQRFGGLEVDDELEFGA